VKVILGFSNGNSQVIFSSKFKEFVQFYGVAQGKCIRFILVVKSLFKVEIHGKLQEPQRLHVDIVNKAVDEVVDISDKAIHEALAREAKGRLLVGYIVTFLKTSVAIVTLCCFSDD